MNRIIGLLVLATLVLPPSTHARESASAPASSPSISVAVPEGNGTPVITDGQFSPGEWDDALRILVKEPVTLHVKELRDVVFIGIRGKKPLDIGPSELLLAVPGGPIHKLHVSAQLGEVVLPPAGDAPPFRFGLTNDWYANELRRDEKLFEQLRGEGKPPIDVILGSSYPVDGIEFAIRRSKLPGDRWLMRLWTSAIIDGKPDALAYPSGTIERNADGWLELRLRPAVDDAGLVENTIRDAIGWALTKNQARLEAVMAHDADLVIFHPDSKTTVRGYEAFAKMIPAFMDPRFRATHFEVTDLATVFSRSGDVAWYSAMLEDCGEWMGKENCWKETRWTGVLEKRQGRWMLVQMHFSFAKDKVLAECPKAEAK